MAVLVGVIAGALVAVSVTRIESVGIDDPVGAISVHGTCGILGTLWSASQRAMAACSSEVARSS